VSSLHSLSSGTSGASLMMSDSGWTGGGGNSASSDGGGGSTGSLALASALSSGASSREQRLRLRSLHWDPFEPSSQSYMNIGAKPRMRSHYRGHKMALWLNLIPQIHLPGGSDVTVSHHAFSDDNPNLYVGK
jgi:hypothetical protein